MTVIKTVRVAKTSKISAVAGSIAGFTRSGVPVAVQAIGVEAINTAVKALALAAEYMFEEHILLLVYPEFIEISSSDQTVRLQGLKFSITLVKDSPAAVEP